MTDQTAPAAVPDDERRCRLLRTGLPSKPGSRRAPGQPIEVATGTIAELVAIVRADDGDDLWRYTIVDDAGEYIRNAELRALVRAQ